jgi:small subunit ribosomal protein S7
MSSKRATKTTFLPRALNERQRTRQAIAWILKASERGRQGGAPRAQRVAREILAVLEGQSDVYKWLEDRHKSVAMNRYVAGRRLLPGNAS